MIKYRKDGTPEKRKRPDILMRLLTWLAVIGWFLMYVVLMLVHKAKPKVESSFDRVDGMESPLSVWNPDLIRYIFYMMIAGLIISIIGIILNVMRHRRKKDKYRISLISLGVISLLGIIFYLII